MAPVCREFQVVQTPVEMKHVPLVGSHPFIRSRQRIDRGSHIDGDAMHISFASQELSDRQRVTNGTGVVDQQHPQQAGHISNRSQRRITFWSGRSVIGPIHRTDLI